MGLEVKIYDTPAGGIRASQGTFSSFIKPFVVGTPKTGLAQEIFVSLEVPIVFFRKCSKKARDLWWHGLPPSVRGKVWQLAFGNDLNITHGEFIFYRKVPKFLNSCKLCCDHSKTRT